MAAHSSIVFITGGVRSGKSRFAEKTAANIWASSPNNRLHYIAAMEPTDTEMRNRIFHHQEDRINSGLDWQTWEKSTKIVELAAYFNEKDIVLLDCLTTWLNNELFFHEEKWQDQSFQEELLDEMWKGILTISKQAGTFIIVSNEVFNEPVGSNTLVSIYKKILGNLHQRIVAHSYQAFLVESGISTLMRGER